MAAKAIRKSGSSFEAAISRIAPILQGWRLQHKPPEAIPEELWRGMAGLAREYGTSPVARALRIDYNALRRRVAITGQAASEGGAMTSAFVEVPMPPWSNGQGVIELEDKRGSKLTLRLPACDIATVLALAQGLWKQRT